MPPSEPLRVFISYARKDGAELAHRLQKDLNGKGFDAWLDTQRIKGGATWTTDVEHALDEAEYVLALMTSGSYVSEICRAEQLRALRKHKCVIPLKAQASADVPLHLEAKNYRDFTADSRYPQAFNKLLADLHARNGIALKPEFRETSYVTVPPLPVNFVERPEALGALRDALITDDGGRHIALTALQGMGGIGKTVLAQALCHDEVVQQAFPDGIIWITIGKESAFDALTSMREVGKALGDDLSRYENVLAAKNQYRSTIRKKAALIVVDDVWRSSDLETLRAEDSPRSRLLFTTRDASIAAAAGAREHIADLLSDEQSCEVLARWSRTDIAHRPPIAAQLIHECGRLPLALSMMGAMLRGKPAAYWNTVLEHLRNADLDRIKAHFPDYPYTDVLRAIQVSVDSLDETSRARYLALAILLEDMAAAPPVQQCLWEVDENEAVETAEQFVNLSLAQRDQPEGSIRLHDLQLDYVRAQYSKEDKEALDLIRGAVRLSSNVIEEDPAQLASQLVGRLLTYEDIPAIQEFTKRIACGTRTPWLRSLQATLHRPGTALVRTLEGHLGRVTGVSITPDGQRAVSASDDQTLKVWDLDSGRDLRTLIGHGSAVTAVAVTPDGQLAVSASWDKTLKVWDLVSGSELRTLIGHSEAVLGVAVTHGHRAVSASTDWTLKVWDLASGRELCTLSGHTCPVCSVAVTPDEQRAVSGSSDFTLKVWDLAGGSELCTLTGHEGIVEAVAVTPDGQRVVSASWDHTLKVWELASGRELRTLTGHKWTVNAVAVTSDGQRAVSASGDKTLKVWELASGCELRTLTGHANSVNAVAVTPDGRRAISASDGWTLKLWELDRAREQHEVVGHMGTVNDVAVTPDGKLAISASEDRTLKVWDLTSGTELRTLTGHRAIVNAVVVTPDGKLVVSAAGDPGLQGGELKVWELDSGRELRGLTGHTSYVNAVAVTPDGQTAVSGSFDNTVKIWDLASGRELRTLIGHSNWVSAVAVTPDGQRAVSASSDNTLKLWDLDSGRELRTLTGHSDWVTAVVVTPDGHHAVSASNDQTLVVWDLDTGQKLRVLAGHRDPVQAVAVTPNGRRAVSASYDWTVRVWDLDTAAVLATLTCDSGVHCCAYSDALKLIVAGDAGGHLHFLRLEEPKAKG